MLSKTKRVMDLIVFVFTSLAIAGVFYEGMTLKWYSFVGILVVCMDYSFLFATLMHLVTDRKTKNIWLHVFSLVIISMALIMKFVNVAYPAITLVLWYFYIWFFYGSMSAKWVFGLPRK